MNGIYRVIVQSKKVVYDFEVRSNITIITGDSAKGKTTLVNYIGCYAEFGKDSGVNLICEKPCKVISGFDWQNQLRYINDSIVFIDVGNKFVKSEEFSNTVKNSDNYYVLITREKLNNLSYSVNDVYRMAESCKYKNVKQVHNQLFQLNGRLTWKQIMEQYPDTWVGLTDIQWENESNIESAIVKYTDKTKSELLRMVVNNEIEFSCYTTPDNIFQLGIIGVIKR